MQEGLGGGGYIDFVGGKEQQIAFGEFERSVEDDGEDDTGSDDVEGVITAVDQHLVHDDLEEERNGKTQDGEGRHEDGDLPEYAAHTDKFRNEPCQTERAVFIGEVIGLFETVYIVGAELLKLLLIEDQASSSL